MEFFFFFQRNGAAGVHHGCIGRGPGERDGTEVMFVGHTAVRDMLGSGLEH
jgi:hypothetical protein